MGSFSAGKTLVSCLIYFLVLGTILNISNTFLVSLDRTPIGFNDNDALEFSYDLTSNSCDSPRYYPYVDGVQKENTQAFREDCGMTNGIFYEGLCTSISGCSWGVDSPEWWEIWKDDNVSDTCLGEINTSDYNNGTERGVFQTICDLSSLQDNETLCNTLGCTYFEHTEGISKHTSEILWVQIGNVFTLSFETGLPSPYNEVILIFMLYLPLIMFLIAGYYMLPFIH